MKSINFLRNGENMSKVLKYFLFSLIFFVYMFFNLNIVNVSADSTVSISSLDIVTNRTIISNDLPSITVLTHGLSCDASVWSNDGSYFSYDEESLIEKIRQKNPQNTVVYGASVDTIKGTISKNNMTVSDSRSRNAEDDQINERIGAESLANSYYLETGYDDIDKIVLVPQYINDYYFPRIIDDSDLDGDGVVDFIEDCQNAGNPCKSSLTMDDIDKHIIIIFQQNTSYTRESNDYVYMQFEYILDNLSYDYYNLTGSLPTFNLIAHSRGGLTNMQYALAHPYNVASLYSVGSPYNGSHLAAYPFLLELPGFESNYNYLDRVDYEPGVLDILNSNLTDSYKNYWNEFYMFFEHINFVPIGSYADISVFNNVLLEANGSYINISPEDLEKIEKIIFTLKEYYENETFYNLNYINGLLNSIRLNILDVGIESLIGINITEYLLPLDDINFLCPSSENIDVEELTHMGQFNEIGLFYYDDLFIHLNSQIAEGYLNNRVIVKQFTTKDYENCKKAVNSVGLIHNLETRNPDIINFIINDIDLGNSTKGVFEYIEHDKFIEIVKFNGNVSGESLSIPEYINGKPVEVISKNAFDKDLWDINYNSITKIEIPKTIKEIRSYAFSNCDNITEIHIPNDAALEIIYDNAFFKTSITDIDLPDNLINITPKTFEGCTFLENINSSGIVFESIDGVLFNKNMTKLIKYPQNKNQESYTVDLNVTEISENAFTNNKFLKNLFMNSVLSIGKNAFSGCINLEFIDNVVLNYAYSNSLDDTKWYLNQGEFVILGNVLIGYEGDDSTISLCDYPKSISCIGSGAFMYKNINHVEIPDSVSRISKFSFFGCIESLEIYLFNNLLIEEESFDLLNENYNIYVPLDCYDEYILENFEYPDRFKIIQTSVVLIDVDENVSNEIFYYNEVFELPISDNTNLYYKWYDENGLLYSNDNVWNSIEKSIILRCYVNTNVSFKKQDNSVILECEVLLGDVLLFSNYGININSTFIPFNDLPNQYYYYYFLINGVNISNEIVYDCSFFIVDVVEVPINYTITFVNTNPLSQNSSFVKDLTILNCEIEGLSYFELINITGVNFSGVTLSETSLDSQIITDSLELLYYADLSENNEITVYVIWEYIVYSIYFDLNGGFFSDEETPVSYSFTIKEGIDLYFPELTKTYYSTGVYRFENEEVAFGESIHISSAGNRTYWVDWTPIEYNITYVNLLLASSTNLVKTFTMINKTTLSPAEMENYEFMGWYKDKYFTTEVEEVGLGTGINSSITLYAKWKINSSISRTEIVGINDDTDLWGQYYDEFTIKDLTGYTASQLIVKGFKTITITLRIYTREINDGYQHIYIYNGDSENYKCIGEYEYGSGNIGVQNDFVLREIELTVNLSEFRNSDKICLFYEASGALEDDWENMIIEFRIEGEESYAYTTSSSGGGIGGGGGKIDQIIIT